MKTARAKVAIRTLRGTVCSGTGSSPRSMRRVLAEVCRRSGLRLRPGTVNVRLSHWYTIRHDLTIWAHESGHHEHLFFERCAVFGKPALIVRTSQNHHGSAVIEVMGVERIRRNHRVKIGDRLAVRVLELGPRPKEPGKPR